MRLLLKAAAKELCATFGAPLFALICCTSAALVVRSGSALHLFNSRFVAPFLRAARNHTVVAVLPRLSAALLAVLVALGVALLAFRILSFAADTTLLSALFK